MIVHRRGRTVSWTAWGAVIALLTVSCGLPGEPGADVEPSQPGSECPPGDYIEPSSRLQSIDSWWVFEPGRATSGSDAGAESPDGTSVRLDADGFESLDNFSGSLELGIFMGKPLFALTSELKGSAIGGTKTLDDGRLQMSIVAAINADQTLEFVGLCASEHFTGPFGRFVEQQRPGETPAEVFMEYAAARNFSEYADFASPEEPTPAWSDLDPRHRQLDAEFTPAEVLARLSSLEVKYLIPPEWANLPGSLCTWSAQGWNICVAFEAAKEESQFTFPAYYQAGQDLELWVLDADGSFDNPIQLIAMIETVDEPSVATIELLGAPTDLHNLPTAVASADLPSETVRISTD